jgi:outer membrane protein insertion porin family
MLRTLTLFLLLAAPLCTSAQVATAQDFTAGKIVFNHPGDFTQQQLEEVAAIHPGTRFNNDSLAVDAQRLADTGFFDNVGVTCEGPLQSLTVNFDITPIGRSRLLPVGFENFIWLTPAELLAAVHYQSPLFAGSLPENGALEDSIAAALTQALAAKGIANTAVQHETIEPTLEHPLRALEFRVAAPRPVIANIKLAGVTADLVPLIQKSVNSTARTRYNAGLSGSLTSESILKPLLDAGYLQATLTGLSLAPGAPDAHTIPVVLSATLAPGDIYKVSTLTFTGTPLLSADDFAKTTKLHPGDIASRQALLETFAPLDLAYRRRGHMDVIINSSPTLDTAAHTVAYTVTVTPGEQYHVHQVTVQGLDPAAQADFDRGYLMKEGALYNPEYLTKFLKNNTALQALNGYAAGFKAIADPNTHTVDLVITFVRGAASEVH